MNELDPLIDNVAHQMTAGSSSVDIRAKVLARLGDRQPSRWSLRLAPVAAGLAVAVLMIVVLNRRSEAPSPEPQPPSLQASVRSSSSDVPRIESEVPSATPQASRVEPPSAADLAWRDRAMPALDYPDAITLERIQPAALNIRPLYTTPLMVPPIDESGGRQHN